MNDEAVRVPVDERGVHPELGRLVVQSPVQLNHLEEDRLSLLAVCLLLGGLTYVDLQELWDVEDDGCGDGGTDELERARHRRGRHHLVAVVQRIAHGHEPKKHWRYLNAGGRGGMRVTEAV